MIFKNRYRVPYRYRYRFRHRNRERHFDSPLRPILNMAFGHENLDVYQLSLRYVAWVFSKAESLSGSHRHTRDQWLRASQSIPLNIAEGNGKATEPDRRRFFETARGSALECAAIQDILEITHALAPAENASQKEILNRIAAMLTRLGGRGYTAVKEDPAEYPANDFEEMGQP